MDPIITNALMTFGAGFTGATFSKAQGPGQALDDIMSLVGFDRLHEVAEKKRAKRELNIQRYKDTIAQNIVAIPEDNLQDPQLSIVGPALEASKYYIEEDELREMFAKLIASSMNSEVSSFTHPSFVEVIKQLSPKEARLLKELKFGAPLGKVIIIEKDNDIQTTVFPPSPLKSRKAKTIFENFYYSENNKNLSENEFSISVLNRLGLVSVDTQFSLSDKTVYTSLEDEFDFFKNSPTVTEDKKNFPPDFEFELHKGAIILTSFGRSFFNTCIE